MKRSHRMKVLLYVDNKGYTKKMTDQTPCIINRILRLKCEITVEELAEAVGQYGHSFTPAVFKDGAKHKTKDSFLQQSVFAIDIDDNLSSEDFLCRCKEYDLHPAFLYHTFSSTKAIEKFRAVFVLEKPITDSNIAEFILVLFFEVFPETDNQCKDCSRLFYGGKELFYTDFSAVLDIEKLILAAHARLKQDDSGNFRRKIVNISKKYGLKTNESIFPVYNRKFARELVVLPDDYIWGNLVFKRSGIDEKQNCKKLKKKNREQRKQKIDEKKISQFCKLFEEHINGADLEHGKKFLLATNLYQLHGGKSLFFEGIVEADKEKWKAQWDYISKQEYSSQECGIDKCPYFKVCGEPTNMLSKLQDKKIYKNAEVLSYISLENAEKRLREALKESIKSQDNDIHIIKAQTGLGKTSIYCEMVSDNPEKNFMIVVPTLKLQDEVVKKLLKMNISAYPTLSTKVILENNNIEIEGVEQAYKANRTDFAKVLIRENLDINGNISQGLKEKIRMSMEQPSLIAEEKVVVTTHAMFLALPKKLLKKYEVIVDEDLLRTIMNYTKSISLDALRQLCEYSDFPLDFVGAIKNILNQAEEKEVILNEAPIKVNNDRIREYIKWAEVLSLLLARFFIVDRYTRSLIWGDDIKIPDVKMTILSATADEKMYQDFCKNRKVKFREIPKVEYVGRLIQYSHAPLSRENIRKLTFEKVTDAVFNVTENVVPLITFKEYATRDLQIYFGKTEGFDELKGKNIAVVGTPHKPEALYKYTAMLLGYDITETLHDRRVKKGIFEFRFMTYKDLNLQRIQFWYIEGELLQAIGRARLLRENAVVWAFTNFPLEQAELIQEKYIY